MIFEQPDGTWLIADGTKKLATGIYVFEKSKWTPALSELQRLINKVGLKEQELQGFFEAHPELILDDIYSDVFPQATIIKDNKNVWRADFVLVPSDQLSFSKILELKLPAEKISLKSRHGHNNYSAKLIKAIHQLQDYHQAFDSEHTKTLFKEKYRTDIFRPDLHLVIGRKNSIQNNRAFLELQDKYKVKITDWDSLFEYLKKKYR